MLIHYRALVRRVTGDRELLNALDLNVHMYWHHPVVLSFLIYGQGIECGRYQHLKKWRSKRLVKVKVHTEE